MTTENVFKIISKFFTAEHLGICSLGRTAEECYKYIPHDQVLFLDCLGSVADTAVGIALGCSNSNVFAFETDGSFLFNLSAIHTFAELQSYLTNFSLFIFDNRKLESGGGLPSRLAPFDWRLMFKTWGIFSVEIFEESMLEEFLASRDGTSLRIAILHIDNSLCISTCTKDIDGRESKYMFKRYINQNIKKGIIKPCIKN